jgi:hypothetical protein
MASTISAGTTAGTAVAITGDTSGNLSLLTQNGANTITVPNGTGTMSVNGVSSNIVAGTAVASTSGTSIDYTSIPSWVKRITILFNQVSTNGTSHVIVQIGAGSVTTTGYNSNANYVINGGTVVTTSYTTGYGIIPYGGAGDTRTMVMTINLIGANAWICGSTSINPINTTCGGSAGSVTLGGTLDRVRITTINGTDTFDAGTINILYE